VPIQQPEPVPLPDEEPNRHPDENRRPSLQAFVGLSDGGPRGLQ
jgi:hypothetical protein